MEWNGVEVGRAWSCLAAAVFILLTAACGASGPLDDLERGERGRVTRIVDGDALALNTGQSVRLIGIEAPALRPRGREPDSWAVESSRALEDIVMGREVQLYYSGLTRDRYDRALAHVVTIDQAGAKTWVNMELVRRGAARVRLYPDTATKGQALLEAEAKARDANLGLWGKADYKIRPADRISSNYRGFTLVTATLGAKTANAEPSDRHICKRRLQGAELILEIRPEAKKICDLETSDELILRGWVSSGRMDLTLPLHVQSLANAE